MNRNKIITKIQNDINKFYKSYESIGEDERELLGEIFDDVEKMRESKRNFIKLIENSTGTACYVELDTIKIVVPLTEDLLHENDYGYSEHNAYDKETIFSGIKTTEGIIHVKETPDEVISLMEEYLDIL